MLKRNSTSRPYVIRDEKDFEKMLPLKNFLIYLEQTVKKPMTQESVIQASWNLSEDRALIPSTRRRPS